ncbi:MAG: 16S rRNA (cytosine(967)-C(5))-methyltransferase RsmB, partial [Clostridiales bacterium]|nr:16S rRNA (cytosine(967)-C(5))-methyltransferase RsmB [Clostridiales bacterium]
AIAYRIDRVAKRPLRTMKPYIAATLEVAAAQVFYDDRIPDRAAIHEAVELVKHSRYQQLSGFVNGVLRAVLRAEETLEWPSDPAERLQVMYALPAVLVQEWIDTYGLERAEDLCRRLDTESALTVRCNTLKNTPEEILTALEMIPGQEGITPSVLCPWMFRLKSGADLKHWPLITEGRIVVQNESAALAAMLTQAAPGMKVLDLCAAPGGKSTMMAQMMQDQGQIISCDIYDHKVERIRTQAERMGITCIDAVLQDGTVLRQDWIEAFDVVLVDAPCSGWGIVRNKPDIRLNRSAEDHQTLEKLQKELLQTAQHYVRPGGRLVYSTCTLRPAENEAQTALFSESFPRFAPQDPQKDLPTLDLCDTIKDGHHGIIVLPEPLGADGFYLAAWKKNVEEGRA